VIETITAKLDLAISSFEGSGPTGPSVTVNVAVSFKPAAAIRHSAQRYQSQLLANDPLQGVQGPDAVSLTGASPYLLGAIERMSQISSDFVHVRADPASDHSRIP